MAKAPIYREQGATPLQPQFELLREVCLDLLATSSVPREIADKLNAALDAVEVAIKANTKISRGGSTIGYGLDREKKAIACDTAIAILRTIRGVKAW